MAEFCADCARKYLGLTEKQVENVVLSKEPDLCEGCGQIKPVVVEIASPLRRKIKKIFAK